MEGCRGPCLGIPIEGDTFEKYPDNVKEAWLILDKWVINIHKKLNRDVTQEDMGKMPEKVKEAMELINKTPIPDFEGVTGKDSCYMVSLLFEVNNGVLEL